MNKCSRRGRGREGRGINEDRAVPFNVARENVTMPTYANVVSGCRSNGYRSSRSVRERGAVVNERRFVVCRL